MAAFELGRRNSAIADDPDSGIGSPEDAPVVGDLAVDGWCYIDPTLNGGKNESLVRTCPKDQRHMILFVGAGNPEADSLTFLQCRGADFGT